MLKKLKTVLDKYKMDYRVPSDGEGNVTLDCPFCGADRERFGIHIDTGKWNCFKCSTSGLSLDKLDKRLRDMETGKKDKVKPKEVKKKKKKGKLKFKTEDIQKFEKRLVSKKGKLARKHLIKERGFSKETIKHFRLGSCEYTASEYFSIPYIENGELVNLKYRIVEPPPEDKEDFKEWKSSKWRREKGGKSALFNGDVLRKNEFETVIVTEAECDAMAIYNAGFKNVVSATVGAKGFKTDWYDLFENATKIYICYDNDSAGRVGARKMATRLGLKRSYIVDLPDDVNDVNEFFWNPETQTQRYEKEDFKLILDKAQKVSIDQVTTLTSVLDRIGDKIKNGDSEDTDYISSPWPKINRSWKGVRPGHMVIVAARPKCGKSSLTLYWMYHLCNMGYPVFFICCEMRDESLAKRIIARNRKNYMSDELITYEDVRATRASIPSDDFHFWYPTLGDLKDFDLIEEKIREVVERYGCRFIVFDNIQFANRDERGNTGEKTGQLTRMFKALAEELDCVFFAVSQPRKLNSRRDMTEDDLKDSSSILQDTDHLFILNRNYGEEEDPLEDDFDDEEKVFNDDLQNLMSVKVTSRWFESSRHLLYYHKERCIFKDNGRAYDRLLKMRKETQEKD